MHQGSWLRFTLLLTIALAAALWPSVLGGRVLLPLDLLSHNPPHTPHTDAGPVHNPLTGDMLYENFMWKVFQRRAIASGDWPLWNPYSFCGHPLYTTGQASTFYPLNALFWVMPPARAYVLFIGLHLLLGGLFTYLLFCRLGVGHFGATVGGFVFAMGGFFICRLVFPMLLASAIWLPLMLLWLHRLCDARQTKDADPAGNDAKGGQGAGESASGRVTAAPSPATTHRPRSSRQPSLRSLTWGAPLFALPILGGFFEIAFYAFAACGLFALVHAVQLAARRRSAGQAIRYLASAATVVILGTVLAAPQILPFLEVMKRNVRTGEGTFETAKAAALAACELLPVVIPDALGNPTVHEGFRLSERRWQPIDAGNGYRYFGPKNYVEVGSYLGILPLVFTVLGLGTAWRQSRWLAAFFVLLAAVSLSFAFVTPVYRLFFHLVPGAEQVRTPFRWIFLTCFAVTYLAAAGAQRWFDGLSRPPTRGSRIGADVLLGIALLLCTVLVILLFVPAPIESISRRILASSRPVRTAFRSDDEFAGLLWTNAMRLAIFLLGAAAFIALGTWRAWQPRSVLLLSLGALGFIAIDLAQASFSFNTHADPGSLDRVPPVIEHLRADRDLFRIGRYGPEKIFYANLPTLYGLQDYGGYDSIILRDYAQFLGGIEPQHLLRYNIVMTLERRGSLDSPLLPLLNIRYLLTQKRFEHPDWEQVPVEGNVKLYRIRPEKELPRAFLVDRVRAVGSLSEAIDALKSGGIDVRREAVVQAPAETAAKLTEPGAALATARVAEYRPSSVTVATKSDRRALLVMCDVHYPGWKAYLDGAAAELYATDGVFRGVSVPAGEHKVVFRFEPATLRIGAVASLICLMALAAIGVWGSWPGRPGESEQLNAGCPK